jgi:hypothetical protein
MSNPFAGNWTYRSFLNNPALTGGDPVKLAALLFAEGTLAVQDTDPNVFEGQLSFGPSEIMDLKGVATPAQTGIPRHVHIVGTGRPGTPTEHYFYDYDGALTEHWPNGINQVPAITGSAIRVKPHDGKPAGLVASFIAIKQTESQEKVRRGNMSGIVGFAKDIRPLFTQIDIEHMSPFFDLSDYDDVKDNAQSILQRLKGQQGAVMPPPPTKGGDGPWSAEKIELFQSWVDGGFNP